MIRSDSIRFDSIRHRLIGLGSRVDPRGPRQCGSGGWEVASVDGGPSRGEASEIRFLSPRAWRAGLEAGADGKNGRD